MTVYNYSTYYGVPQAHKTTYEYQKPSFKTDYYTWNTVELDWETVTDRIIEEHYDAWVELARWKL